MSTLLQIPAQVWFLLAGGAVCVLLADAAVRSWKSPERVADPSTLWPRWAPVISDRLIGPRLPGGSFMMPEPGLRLAFGPRGSYFEDTAVHPQPAPEVDWSALRQTYRTSIDPKRAEALRSGPWVTEPAEHEGATEAWSPIESHAAAEQARLPLDDVDEWLAERVREFEHALSRIDCRRISLVKGEAQATLDEQLQQFVEGPQQLHAYRMLRIGETGGYGPREHMQLESLLVDA